MRLRWHSCILLDVESSAGNGIQNSSALYLTISVVAKDVEQLELSLLVGMQTGVSTVEDGLAISHKVKPCTYHII